MKDKSLKAFTITLGKKVKLIECPMNDKLFLKFMEFHRKEITKLFGIPPGILGKRKNIRRRSKHER